MRDGRLCCIVAAPLRESHNGLQALTKDLTSHAGQMADAVRPNMMSGIHTLFSCLNIKIQACQKAEDELPECGEN